MPSETVNYTFMRIYFYLMEAGLRALSRLRTRRKYVNLEPNITENVVLPHWLIIKDEQYGYYNIYELKLGNTAF